MEDQNEIGGEEMAEEAETAPLFLYTSQEFLKKYSHCAICGSNLHFTHMTDFLKNLTQETARCPECGLQARRATHRLQ